MRKTMLRRFSRPCALALASGTVASLLPHPAIGAQQEAPPTSAPKWESLAAARTPVVCSARSYVTPSPVWLAPTPAPEDAHTDVAFVAGVLRTNLTAKEMASTIVQKLSHLERSKVQAEIQASISTHSQHSSKMLGLLAAHLVTCIQEGNLLFAFTDHVANDWYHPFVHYGEGFSDGLSAVERLAKPFINDRLTNIESTAKLPCPSDKVFLVYGESGSGKTHRALFSNPGGLTVYLLFNLDFELKYTKEKPRRGQPFLPIHRKDRHRFRKLVLDRFAQVFSCSEVYDKLEPATVWDQMRDLHVRIVVDELGSKPNLIRLFIEERRELERALCVQREQQDSNPNIDEWPRCKSLDIVLVGTGVELHGKLRSDICAYEHVWMEPAGTAFFVDVVRKQWTGHTNKIVKGLPRLLDKDEALWCIRDLIGNRRAAVLAASKFIELMKLHNVSTAEEMERVFRQCAGDVVHHVAVQYKGLNALDRLTADELRETALEAIAIAMPQRKRLKPTVPQLEEYVAKLGLLVNPETLVMAAAKGIAVASGKEEEQGPGPKMSPAVRLMLLMFSGFTDVVTLSASGSGLERLVALKCLLALLISSDAAQLHQMLHTAAFTPLATKKRPTRMTISNEVLLLDLRHCLSRPENSTSDTELEEAVADTISDVAELVKKGRSVVILNGAGAPYADVIVVSHKYIGFFDAKDGADLHPKSEAKKLFEGKNRGITKALCRIARVDPSDVGIVIVSRTHLTTVTSKPGKHPRWHVVGPDEDFLFPFPWNVISARTQPSALYDETVFPCASRYVV